MKKIIFLGILTSCVFFACKKDPDYSKPGVSLPAVSNLSLQNTDNANVRINWQNPSNIPAEMEQPLSINIQVNEILGVTRTVPAAVVNLPNAPSTFSFRLPDPAKTYHFTVKVFGNTKSKDRNYSTTIYSLGETVEYKR